MAPQECMCSREVACGFSDLSSRKNTTSAGTSCLPAAFDPHAGCELPWHSLTNANKSCSDPFWHMFAQLANLMQEFVALPDVPPETETRLRNFLATKASMCAQPRLCT